MVGRPGCSTIESSSSTCLEASISKDLCHAAGTDEKGEGKGPGKAVAVRQPGRQPRSRRRVRDGRRPRFARVSLEPSAWIYAIQTILSSLFRWFERQTLGVVGSRSHEKVSPESFRALRTSLTNKPCSAIDYIRFDLRSIMAEAETKSPKLGPSTPPTGVPGKYLPPSARRTPSAAGPSVVSTVHPGISPVQPSTPGSVRPDRAASWRNAPPTGSPAGSASASAFPTLGSTPTRPGASKNPSQSGPPKNDVIVPTRQPTVSRKSS